MGASFRIGYWLRDTAGPSATLGMTKGRVVLYLKIGYWLKALATPLAFSRDNKD